MKDPTGVTRLCDVPDAMLSAVENLLPETEQAWARADAGKPNRFGVFEGSVQHLVLQYPNDLRDHRSSRFFPQWANWAAAVEPIVTLVGAALKQRLGFPRGASSRIMLARLRPGGEIKRHVDSAPSAAATHKVHVPIRTQPGVEFWVEDEVHFLERGGAFEVNNKILHGGRNASDVERIHLVFDYYGHDLPA
jgi:hypothetical protein